MQNFKINAQVCKYSLVDLNINHCVELTFFGGKLSSCDEGRKIELGNINISSSELNQLHFFSNCNKFKKNSLQERLHKKSTQLALKKCQF